MLDDLDDDELDALPFGVICLGEELRVERMNRVEADSEGIQRWRALGRDFFGDVASAPGNRALAEQVAAFAADRTPVREVAHTFERRAGRDETRIVLRRGRAGRVYLCVYRAASSSPGAAASSARSRVTSSSTLPISQPSRE
ncbi:MAG TPA: PAS domain-containing protein [Kofleriaceae bacterium]|nr:PAS domain-containing protein [Kofleriaceae bacterium]